MQANPLVIFAAAASEAAAVRRAVTSPRRGRIVEPVSAPPPDGLRCRCWMGASDGTSVAIVQGGVGFRRALRVSALARQALRPGGVVVLGFAGSLRADLKPGALLVAEHTRTEAAGGLGAADIASHPMLVRAAVAAGEAAGIPTACGRLVTVAAPAETPAAKAALADATGAWAVDMEAAAVAAALAPAGLPFLAVKVIFDAAHEPLHPVLMDVVRPDGSPRLLRAALLAVRDREARVALHWAGRRARWAGRTLTRFCRAFLPVLAAGWPRMEAGHG